MSVSACRRCHLPIKNMRATETPLNSWMTMITMKFVSRMSPGEDL